MAKTVYLVFLGFQSRDSLISENNPPFSVLLLQKIEEDELNSWKRVNDTGTTKTHPQREKITLPDFAHRVTNTPQVLSLVTCCCDVYAPAVKPIAERATALCLGLFDQISPLPHEVAARLPHTLLWCCV
jgi:hypothetical protein